MTAPAEDKNADLVLSGGSVKGVGLVGAIVALMEAGHSVQRVSGTSAGSVVGAILAAASGRHQLSAGEVRDLALKIDYRKFLDAGPLESVPLAGPAWALLRGSGIYRGDYAHQWVRGELKNLGIKTFGDLAVDDDDLPEERRYKLVVTVADVTTRQLVRLPWDYRRVYGLDPDEQPVADAVRASMAIPFVFRSATVTSRAGVRSTLVDGGLLSNFPIDSLDRADGKDPRWPTFGITVMPSRSAGDRAINPTLRLLQLIGAPPLLEGVVATTLFGRDHAYLNQPWVAARTIEVDAGDVGLLDFDISKQDTQALYAKGYGAAQEFLSRWDWADYLKQFRR